MWPQENQKGIINEDPWAIKNYYTQLSELNSKIIPNLNIIIDLASSAGWTLEEMAGNRAVLIRVDL